MNSAKLYSLEARSDYGLLYFATFTFSKDEALLTAVLRGYDVIDGELDEMICEVNKIIQAK